MFFQTIKPGSVPLIGPDADLFFGDKISGDKLLRDDSWVATLRALIGNRLNGKTITFKAVPMPGSSESDLNKIKNSSSIVQLVYLDSSVGGDRGEITEQIRQHIDGFKGWSRVEKATQFYKPVFTAYAWSNEKKNSAIILTDNMDIRRLHFLQACIPIILPWYFPGDGAGRFTEDELALIRSFNSKEDTPYRAAIIELAKKFDMREYLVRKKLDNLSKRYYEIEANSAEDAISRIDSMIREYYNQITNCLRDRNETQTRLLGLRERAREGGGNELTEFFLSNPFLDLDRVDGTRVLFTSSGFFENWDDDVAESHIDNLRAEIYAICENKGIAKEKFQNLLRAVFLDRHVKMKVYAQYDMDIMGNISTCHMDVPPDKAEYMPNPHIDEFNCLGEYKRQILECLRTGSTLQAFTYCVASSRSINWGDSAVIRRFIGNMCDDLDKLKCYVLPDGTAANLEEALAWANEE